MDPVTSVAAHSPAAAIAEWSDVDQDVFQNEILPRRQPAVLRGIAARWPAVEAAKSAIGVRDYLARFDQGATAPAFVGPPEIGGRFFYGGEPNGLNFRMTETRVGPLVAELIAGEEQDKRLSLYMGSTPVPQILPGFERENPMPLLGDLPVEPRIWIGSRTRVAAHFDESRNIACVVRGRRRFTLFPPDQVANLYVGPLDSTPAGQPISMVDFAAPDFDKYPRFREALENAQVAELAPGDAIYIPPIWWHHVEALERFNILVNYWWQDVTLDMGSGIHCLGHGIMTLSHLPEEHREAWRALFDHYVFKRNGDPAEHLAPMQKGILGESTPQLRRLMRQFLVSVLNR